MKTLIAICLLSCAGFAQIAKPTPDQTKLDAFSARAGILVEKEFVPVGNLGTIKIEVYRVKDLMSKAALSGVRFSKVVSTSAYSSDEKTAILDADEVDGLLKSIELLKPNFVNGRDNYTEIVYSSRGGFSAGAFYTHPAWKTFVRLDKYDSRSAAFLDVDDMDKLYALLTKAKDLLTK